jgi:hypothetical protein
MGVYNAANIEFVGVVSQARRLTEAELTEEYEAGEILSEK